jgi:glutamate synthase (NADPH/NADH) small chain
MGKITGFMEFERVEEGYKPVEERVKNYKEFVIGLDDAQAKAQSARCMTAAHRFATAAALSTTSFPTSTTWYFKAIGKTPLTCCTAPTTFQSSRAVFAPLHVKPLVH